MSKKIYLFFKIYLFLALINALYSIFVRITTGVDYTKLNLISSNLSKLPLLTIFFGVLSLGIIISSIIFLVISYRKKLSKYFKIYPMYNIAWNIIWFFLIPIFVCYYNPVNCLNSLNYFYNFEFIFNIAEITIILYSLLKINS